MESLRRFARHTFRTKTLNFENLRCRHVPRFKGLLHLLVQGLGSGSALGIYCFVAAAAKDHAGPAVVLSTLGVAVVSWITSSCYSEMACRMPLMGSSYLYSYAVFGELVAFLTGWNLILESSISVAIAAQALSHHLDVLSGGKIDEWLKRDLGRFPWDNGTSPEIIAVAVIVFFAAAAVCRSKNLALTIQSCLFVIHMLIIIAVIFLSMFHVNPDNWGSDDKFFRFGANGIVSGAALMMSSLSGIKTIAISAEEVRKPSRNIPISHTLTVLISFVTMFVLALLVTLSVPVNKLALHAPVLDMFEDLHVKNSKYFIGVGCVSGLLLTVYSQMHYCERMVYVMARDKLLPKTFAHWSYRSNTPWTCRILVAGLSGTLAFVSTFTGLMHMMSIGCLFSFSLTCLATIVVRYDPCYIGLAEGDALRKTVSAESFILSRTSSQLSEATTGSDVSHTTLQLKETAILLTADKGTTMQYSMDRFPTPASSPASTVDLPDLRSYRLVVRVLWISVLLSVCLAVTLRFAPSMSDDWAWVPVAMSLTFVFSNICCSLFVFRAPTNGMPLVYSASGVPFLQIFAIMCLTVMLFHLPAAAWIRWTSWSLAGLLVYLWYSRTHSAECIPVVQEMFFQNQTVARAV